MHVIFLLSVVIGLFMWIGEKRRGEAPKPLPKWAHFIVSVGIFAAIVFAVVAVLGDAIANAGFPRFAAFVGGLLLLVLIVSKLDKAKASPETNDADIHAEDTSQPAENGIAADFLAKEDIPKAEIVRLVDRHGKTLVVKFNTLVQTDDYGNRFYDKWFDERDYFIEHVIRRDFGPMPFNLSDEEIQAIVDNRIIDLAFDLPAEQGQDVDALSATEYEAYCASLLNRQGWRTTLTKASGDQGADIVAEKDGTRLAIQCKKYSSPVGNGAVQEIIAGKAFYNADIGVVVTNATYTPHARQLAHATQIRLLHHSQLNDLDAVLLT